MSLGKLRSPRGRETHCRSLLTKALPSTTTRYEVSLVSARRHIATRETQSAKDDQHGPDQAHGEITEGDSTTDIIEVRKRAKEAL